MLWFGTYTTDKDTVLVDRQTHAEVWKVINKIVGKTDSVSSLTSNHADSLSESLRPNLENVMNSCYEREILLVAKYPRKKRQREEPDDSSESEPQEESEDLYCNFKEIEDSVPGFLEPGNSESGLQLHQTLAKVSNNAPLCFNLAQRVLFPARVHNTSWTPKTLSVYFEKNTDTHQWKDIEMKRWASTSRVATH